jgi:hypothetical protein
MAKRKGCKCSKAKKRVSSKTWSGGALDMEGLYGTSQKGKKKLETWYK